MFCTKCGNQIKDGYKFCPKCGMQFIVNDPVSNNFKKSDIVDERKIDSSGIDVINSHKDNLIGEQPISSHSKENAYVGIDGLKEKDNNTIENYPEIKTPPKQHSTSEFVLANTVDIIANISLWGWLSIIGIFIYCYFVFTNDSKDTAHYPVIFCVLAMINPIYTIIYDEKSDLSIGIGIIIAVAFCIIATIIGFVVKKETSSGIFVDFLAALTSLQFQYIYLVLILIANLTVKLKGVCLYTTAVLIGMLIPIALTIILYVILAIIAIAVCYVFGNFSKGDSSSSLSSTLQNSNNNVPKKEDPHDPNIRDFYIVYRDGPYGPYDCIRKYPKDVDPSRVLRDLKKEFSNNVSLVDYHIHDSLHDSVLNYR